MEKLVEQLDELRLNAETKSAEDDPSVKDVVESYAKVCLINCLKIDYIIIVSLKAVCDCTFYHENYLTEHEFSEPTAEKDVRDMITLFNAIGELCLTVDINNRDVNQRNKPYFSSDVPPQLRAVINVLSVDYAECIRWRQGSLLYAFVSCKLSDAQWLDENQATFLNYLHEGINYLQSMLSIRKPAVVATDTINNPVLTTLIDQCKSPLNDQQMEEARKALLQQQLMLGEQGQELEQLEEFLEHQQEMNHEALLDIQQQLHQQPHLEVS